MNVVSASDAQNVRTAQKEYTIEIGMCFERVSHGALEKH